MHQRDYTVFLRAYQHGLLLHTMYFSNEIRSLPQYGSLDTSIKFNPQEVKLTEQLVESLLEPFKPKQYHDDFQEKLKKLIEAKQHGKTIEIEGESRKAPIIDMMTALKKSLAGRSSIETKKRNGKVKKLPAARKAS